MQCWADLEKDQRTLDCEEEKQTLFGCSGSVQTILLPRSPRGQKQVPVPHSGTQGWQEKEKAIERVGIGGYRKVEGGYPGIKEFSVEGAPPKIWMRVSLLHLSRPLPRF